MSAQTTTPQGTDTRERRNEEKEEKNRRKEKKKREESSRPRVPGSDSDAAGNAGAGTKTLLNRIFIN